MQKALRNIFGVFSFAPHVDNSNNKRIHVLFNHGGIFSFGHDAVFKQLLTAIWKQFGTLSDEMYDERLEFCTVSFASHNEAELAMAGLNDELRLKASIDSLLAQCNNVEARDLLLLRINQLFKQKKGKGPLLHASWAAQPV